MKAVIFDFFGVIYDDPLNIWLSGMDEAVRSHARIAARNLDLGLTNFQGFLEELSAASGESVHAIASKFSEAGINAGVVRLVDSLQKRTKLCLLSNAHSDELRPILHEHSLQGLFHELVISSEVGMAKPDTGIFLHALERLGTKPHETLFIDDNQHNTVAAQKLGIQTIHYKNTKQLEEALKCVE